MAAGSPTWNRRLARRREQRAGSEAARTREAWELVPDPVEALILDLLESLAPGPRAYADVMEAWRTSCPRLPVWEEATGRGLVGREGALVALTPVGREHLARHRGLP